MINNLSPAFKGNYTVMLNTFIDAREYKESLIFKKNKTKDKDSNLMVGNSENKVLIKTDYPQWSEQDKNILTNCDYIGAEQAAKINQAFLNADNENIKIDIRDN